MSFLSKFAKEAVQLLAHTEGWTLLIDLQGPQVPVLSEVPFACAPVLRESLLFLSPSGPCTVCLIAQKQ